jgi:ApbE superfamily uncharacterized protein (UPF0280 family)
VKVYKTNFTEKESDITIISESKQAILKAQENFFFHRKKLEQFISKNKSFLTSFLPLKVNSDLKIIKLMMDASFKCNVGPMATVAGALADIMLESMISTETRDFEPAKIALVENGGEIAIDSEKSMRVALYAGDNKLNSNLGFLIKKEDCPIGIATSSATIGHAISLGQSDAVTIFAKNATLADGFATAIGNLVKGVDIEKSIKKALDAVNDFDDILGAFICRGNNVGHIGKIPQMIKIEGDREEMLKFKIENSFKDDYEIFK